MYVHFFMLDNPRIITNPMIDNHEQHMSKQLLKSCWREATELAQIMPDRKNWQTITGSTVIFTIWTENNQNVAYGSASIKNGIVTWWASPAGKRAGAWERKFYSKI